MYSVSVLKDNIHIDGSYEIRTKSEMQSIIDDIRKNYSVDDCNTLKRSDKSLIREWCSHNLLYDFHIFRSHTRDVDLDSYPKWYFNCGYFILFCIYMMKG